MVYEQRIETSLEASIGPNGLDEAAFRSFLDRATHVLERLRSTDRPDERSIFDLAARRDDLETVAGHVAHIRETASDVVIFGIGGSSLGGQAVTSIVKNSDTPRIHFPENPDPDSLDRLFKTLPLATTHFFTISKSGGTPEPLAELFAAMADRKSVV